MSVGGFWKCSLTSASDRPPAIAPRTRSTGPQLVEDGHGPIAGQPAIKAVPGAPAMKRAMIVVAADYETHAPSLAALKKQSSVAQTTL